MKKTKISIVDIAKRAKVSTTTVSFILNGKAKEKRISDELTERVLKLVEEVGYRPNQSAQTLRTGKTKIIGLMLEDISDPFFASIAKHIQDIAYEHGYKLIYCSTENGKKRAREFLQMFQQLGVDGYIITAPPGLEEDIQALVDSGKDVVLFDRQLKNVSADYVTIDNQESAYKGTQHLIAQGYKKIAFFTLATSQPQMASRLKGYERAMTEHGLTRTVHKLTYSPDYTHYVDKIADIIKTDKNIDAVLFGASYLGISGVEALSRLNINIPQDMAVVSFDDLDLFRLNRPTITAIAQPIEQLAQSSVNRLLDKINDPKKNSKTAKGIVLPTLLMPRESSIRK
jgi:LacI family transcriptional regulator